MPSEQFEQVVSFLRATSPIGGPETFEESRARLDALGAVIPVPDDVEVTSLDVAGVPCERIRPAPGTAATGRIVYAHGGSYTAGSLASHRALTARLARACGCEVLAVDYRLAPEHPHPAGLDDLRAVYGRLTTDDAPPEQVVVAGDSAGGGLVTALVLSLREEGLPLPAGAVLLSPWLDLTLTSESVTARAGEDPVLRADALARSAAAYAGDDLRRPLVSPVVADPTGLQPFLVLVGTAEILLDDSRAFAERAQAAGVDVELFVGEGLIHVWPFIDGVPESGEAMERVARWVRRRLDRSEASRR